jgi:hypothetical protein
MPQKIGLVLLQIGRVRIMLRLVERLNVPAQSRMLAFQLVRSTLEPFVFFALGLGHPGSSRAVP